MKSAPIIQLSFAIVSEVFGTTFMKMSDGFTHPVFGLATAACYIISFALLTLALKHVSLGSRRSRIVRGDRLARTLRGRVFMCPECAAVAARRRKPR